MDSPARSSGRNDVESRDFLGFSVIENRKIVLLQVRDGRAFAVNHHVHFHQAGVDADNGVSWAMAVAAAAARQNRPVHLIDPTI